MSLGPLKLLFVSPEVNPINKKAKSIPILNPIDPYGRVFFFSWLGFMVAFLSWYAFPPLVSCPCFYLHSSSMKRRASPDSISL